MKVGLESGEVFRYSWQRASDIVPRSYQCVLWALGTHDAIC